ncbi:MAG: type I restriction-modification system subunit M [Candidatus Muirbacterium halophilum]|nr:type I restriction-modification system subunit M [Candidatus Muirbacterium halophilum]
MMNFKEKANDIWKIADLLRGDYKQSDYGKVILPFTVLRRLDAILEPTKKEVLDFLPKVETLSEKAKDIALEKKAKQNFYNKSKFDFKNLLDDPNNIASNLRNYINGFSASVRDIISYFSFDDQIEKLDSADLLYQIVKDLSAVEYLKDITPQEMGYIFEELIRKFADASNETAGEHFTPREVIRLMVDILFIDDSEVLAKEGIVKTVYDPACGTGGMLSIADEYVNELNNKAKLELFGQEINPESYAICKSEMLIKGQNPSNIKFGNTFTVDGLKEEKFDYMLSNPPFGVDWKKASKIIKDEHEKQGYDGRFGAGLPRINDGSLLFLQHMVSKIKNTDNGSKIAIVFNGSPLFSGTAGSGESEIRKWIIENDLLETIIALPDQLFYNTGISTYIWILTNNKNKNRKGKIQLINASGSVDDKDIKETPFWKKMDRSLGNKRKTITPEQIVHIANLYGDFKENEFCKILPNEYFGYYKVTVERPQRDENGEIITDRNGNPKADGSLRDSENIPLLKDINEYFKEEVLPYVSDAWIDESKTKIGYEINFSKEFYTFKTLRTLEEVKADILKLEEKTMGKLKEVIS